MFTKRTKTTETYILPEEFDRYNQSGFVIFMSKPTAFGTYRAVKIDLLNDVEQSDCKKEAQTLTDPNRFSKSLSSVKLRLTPLFQ